MIKLAGMMEMEIMVMRAMLLLVVKMMVNVVMGEMQVTLRMKSMMMAMAMGTAMAMLMMAVMLEAIRSCCAVPPFSVYITIFGTAIIILLFTITVVTIATTLIFFIVIVRLFIVVRLIIVAIVVVVAIVTAITLVTLLPLHHRHNATYATKAYHNLRRCRPCCNHYHRHPCYSYSHQRLYHHRPYIFVPSKKNLSGVYAPTTFVNCNRVEPPFKNV